MADSLTLSILSSPGSWFASLEQSYSLDCSLLYRIRYGMVDLDQSWVAGPVDGVCLSKKRERGQRWPSMWHQEHCLLWEKWPNPVG
jgi:hypothetical protein